MLSLERFLQQSDLSEPVKTYQFIYRKRCFILKENEVLKSSFLHSLVNTSLSVEKDEEGRYILDKTTDCSINTMHFMYLCCWEKSSQKKRNDIILPQHLFDEITQSCNYFGITPIVRLRSFIDPEIFYDDNGKFGLIFATSDTQKDNQWCGWCMIILNPQMSDRVFIHSQYRYIVGESKVYIAFENSIFSLTKEGYKIERYPYKNGCDNENLGIISSPNENIHHNLKAVVAKNVSFS